MSSILRREVRKSLFNEQEGYDEYSQLSQNPNLTPKERLTIQRIAKDERRHKQQLYIINKRLTSR